MLDMADFAAVIVEPIQGEGGVNVATPGFMKFLREYTAEHEIALIFDEIQCGLGRTGTIWAYEQMGVTPDILTSAKPLGGGLPLGAVLVKEEIALCLAPGDHGTTFGGNPLACALGKVVLDRVSQKEMLAQIISKGNYLQSELKKVASQSDLIESVLGMGLLTGVRFKDDPKKIIEKAFDKGLLIVKAGRNTVRFIPPLTVTEQEIDQAIAILKDALV